MDEHNFSSEKEYEEDKQIRSIINNFKQNAKTRQLNWDISNETARKLITSNCFYCGSEPLVGIDRIDSSLGYNNNNVLKQIHLFLSKSSPFYHSSSFQMPLHQRFTFFITQTFMEFLLLPLNSNEINV